MKVCVIGLGYIGLPTALLLAKNGHKVFGYDIDENKINTLQKGELPFEEVGMKELFAEARTNFTPTTSLSEAEVFVIAVPTPVKTDKTCDDSYIKKAGEALLSILKKGNLVILESTVAPGTTENVLGKILAQNNLQAGEDFDLAYVSEKAIPGNTIDEMINNDRIIGGIDQKSQNATKELYSSFVKGEMFLTDCKTAEMVKLVENTYRDINIAFANELADLAEKFGTNVWELIELANKHPRVNVHTPGPGVGGHCIAIDPWFLTAGNESVSKLITNSRNINDNQPQKIVEKVSDIANKHDSKTIGVLGVAYKKNVDDSRETPATTIIKGLEEKGFEVVVTDALVENFAHELISLEEFLQKAEGIVVVTDHDVYKEIDLSKQKWIFDTKNLWSNRKLDSDYYLLGE